MIDFLLLALLAGIGVALTAAPLGAFVVWQRLAYFGDTLAHASLLGVAFGLLLTINIQFTIIISCLSVAILLVLLQGQHYLPSDTLLGIISHSSLALGLVFVSIFNTGRLDLTLYLLGDILSTSQNDVIMIFIVFTVVSLLTWKFWRQLLAITVNEEIAQVEGVPVKQIRLLLLFMLALVIAVAIKVVGVLLITALLIIPAATSRYLSTSPTQMVFIGGLLGCLSVFGGIAGSFLWDTPAGPSIVVCASGIFLLTILIKKRFV